SRVPPNPSLHPKCYSGLRSLPHSGELKRSAAPPRPLGYIRRIVWPTTLGHPAYRTCRKDNRMESQSVIHRYVDAWNQHDTAGLSAAFTATGTCLDPTISAPISRPALAPAVGRAADHSYARLHDGFS